MDRKHTEQFILWKCFRVSSPLELRLRLEQVRVSFSLPKPLILTVFSIYQLPAVQLSWVLACWLHSRIHMYFLSAQTLTLVSVFLLLFRNLISAPVVYLGVKHSSYDEILKRHFFSLLPWPSLWQSPTQTWCKHLNTRTRTHASDKKGNLRFESRLNMKRKEWKRVTYFLGANFLSWEGESKACLTHKDTRPAASTPSLITTSLSNSSPPYDPSVVRRHYSFQRWVQPNSRKKGKKKKNAVSVSFSGHEDVVKLCCFC